MLPTKCPLCEGWMYRRKEPVINKWSRWMECEKCGFGWVQFNKGLRYRRRLASRELWGKRYV